MLLNETRDLDSHELSATGVLRAAFRSAAGFLTAPTALVRLGRTGIPLADSHDRSHIRSFELAAVASLDLRAGLKASLVDKRRWINQCNTLLTLFFLYGICSRQVSLARGNAHAMVPQIY